MPPISRLRIDVFAQARHEFGKIARPETDIQLILKNMIPAIPAGTGRARQGKQVGAIGHAGGGAVLG